MILVLHGYGPHIRAVLQKPGDYTRIALLRFSTFFHVPNIIKDKNNSMGVDGQTLSAPTGTYTIDQLGEWFKQKTKKDEFTLRENHNTNRSEIELGDVKINFKLPGSVGGSLGFLAAELSGPGLFQSAHTVSSFLSSSILFHTSVSAPVQVGDELWNVVHFEQVDVEPGSLLARSVAPVNYLKLNRTEVSTIDVWITDAEGALINLQENLTVVLELI